MAQVFQGASDDFRNAMKIKYGPGLRNAILNANVVWAEVSRKEVEAHGLEVQWSIHTRRSSGTGMAAELGTLPTADRQRYIKPRVSLAYSYHVMSVSGPAMHLSKGKDSAFASAMEEEIQGSEKDIMFDRARQTFGSVKFGNGAYHTGVMAVVNGDPGTGTTLTLDDGGVALDESIMRHFFVGMKLDIVNPADGTVRAGSPVTIDAVNVSARTLTTAAAMNAAIGDNDFVCRTGNYNIEIDGLRALLSAQQPDGANDYDYATGDVSANPNWIAAQAGSTTTGISEVLLEQAGELVETDGDGSSADDKLFVCEQSQRRKLASVLQAQKRYDGKQMTLTSGWKGLELSRGTLVADRLCPTTYIFGIHRPEIARLVGLDFQWDEDDGGMFVRGATDSIEARFKAYDQLAALNRNSHVQVRVQAPSF